MKSTLLRASPAIFAAFLLAGCGGGGGGDTSPSTAAAIGAPPVSSSGAPDSDAPTVVEGEGNTSTTKLTGTAATGAPVAAGLVSVTCSTHAPATTTTAADGSFSIDLAQPVFPCQVSVSRGSLANGEQLLGFTTGDSNVNVTPLTTLIGAYAVHAANGASVTDEALEAAIVKVNGLLATAALPPLPANPLSAAFKPVKGDPYNDYLESMKFTLEFQDLALSDLVTHIASKGAPAAPLRAITVDFSDNQASASIVKDPADHATDVLQLETLSSPLANSNSFHTGVPGNVAIRGTEVFEGLKMSQFGGISFRSKDDGTGYTGAGLPYVTYAISKQCDADPNGWASLIINLVDMNRSPVGADGYITYTADISTSSWKNSNYNKALYASDGTSVVLMPNSNATGSSLQAFIKAYPNACIHNWPNPDAQVPNATKTPSVMLMMGSKNNVTAKRTWFKDIKIGDVVLF